ncbi:MAG: phytoene desaturase family protein [Longimicrobiales bacterium]
MSLAFDAIVIGAGANGLVAATALARAGRKTLVLERAERTGGQTADIEFATGFHAAPLCMDVDWVPPSVVRGLGLTLPERVHADPAIAVATGNGAFLTLSSDARLAADAIRTFSPRDAAAWPDFMAKLRSIAAFLEQLYQVPAPDVDATGFAELRELAGLAWRFRKLGRTGMTDLLRIMPMPAEELLDDAFELAPLKAAIATGAIRGGRHGPRAGGSAFVLLHYMTGGSGASFRRSDYWRTGPNALIATLETGAQKNGVTIRTGARVDRIRVSDDAVTGVVLESGAEIAARTVLSSADPATTLLGMIDPVWLDPEFTLAARNIRYRGCTAFVLYALDGMPVLPGMADAERSLASCVTLSADLAAIERACTPARYGGIAEQPHIELAMPSLRWPDVAPAGCHVLVARTQYVPYTLRDDAPWDHAARCTVADRVTHAIEAVAPGFTNRVLHRVTLGPRDLEDRFGLTEGAFTHGELMLDQILFMRPVPGWGRHTMPLEGLYLCGAGTHPGPAIPGGPGWLAAQAAIAGAAQ